MSMQFHISVEGMEPQVREVEEARLNWIMIEAGEGPHVLRDEILPLDIMHPDAASTPLLQSLG